MPTYKARSVTATLHVTKLDQTLSTRADAAKMVESVQKAKRTEEILASGDQLFERPVGADGNDRGVAGFIGEFEDLPFFLVEAGEHVVHISQKYGIVPTIETPARLPAAPGLAKGSSYIDTASSPLSSLGNTPSFVTPETSFHQASQQDQCPTLSRHDSVIQQTPKEQFPAASPLQALPGFKQKQYPREPLEEQALSLTVETGCHTCPPKQHVKIEVFFNGTLIDTAYINTKRFTLTHGDDGHKHHFHGTRLHFQIEKPWIYRSADQSTQSHLTAEERWAHVASSLAQEASSRGCDARGMLPPTAEYFNALSTVSFPERLKEKAQSSIIDVVVTTGDGGKFSQNRSFVTGPLRMSSTKFGKQKQEEVAGQKDPFTDEMPQTQNEVLRDVAAGEGESTEVSTEADSSDPAPVLPSTSPDIPLARRTRSFHAPQQEESIQTAPPPKQVPKPMAESEAPTPGKTRTPHQEKVDALLKELGLTPRKAEQVPSFKNRRGKEGTPRTVNERVSDILKMNPENQEKAKQDLLTQLSDEGVPLTKAATMRATEMSSGKGRKPAIRASPSSGVDDRSSATGQSLPHTGDIPMLDAADDPVAALAQARMDTVLDFGAPPGGRLAKRIESLSPHRTPVPRLGASPWAGPAEDNLVQEGSPQGNASRNTSASPTKLRRGRSNGLTAGSSDMSENMLNKTDELAVQPIKPLSKSRSTAGGGLKVSAATPAKITGPTQEEALEAFEILEICQGGSITYADAGVQRSVVRVRPGEFNEQALVVGMRFIVL